MNNYERSIKVAFDQISGEIIEAEQVFDTTKNAFIVRKQFHRKEVELYCCECNQKLNVSTSKFDRLHFKHEPHHKPCPLTDGTMTLEEQSEVHTWFLSKESERHKSLKHAIADRLRKTIGVDVNSITVDNKFITDGLSRRKPDVYCCYFDRPVAFEIQLSNLSLKYILERHEFYKQNKIYLIWILDNFEVYDQSQMVRDLKYLTPYQNFFKLDETVDNFKLICTYKKPYVTDEFEVYTVWSYQSVFMHQILFNTQTFDVYFFDVNKELSLKEQEAKTLKEKWDEKQKELRYHKRLNEASSKAEKIISTIKRLKKTQSVMYWEVTQMLNQLDEFEIEIFNKKLDLKRSGSQNKPAIHRWLSQAQTADFGFTQFILNCETIKYDVNETDDLGITCLQEIYNNQNILSKFYFSQALFKRGYNLTPKDKEILAVHYPQTFNKEPIIFELCSRLQERSLVKTVFNNVTFICIIESAKRKSIVGFKYTPNQWLAFGINAIQHYKQYWKYIEEAFDKYGIWDMIMQRDKKETFLNELRAYYDEKPAQQSDIDPIIRDLYPELLLESF